MSEDKLDCYIVPSTPMPMLLPIECIAEVIAKPEIESLEKAPANWMRGHVNWNNQRLPVMSYAALHDASLDESKKRKARLVVLNPVPDAVRKAYSAFICYGDVQQVSVDASIIFGEVPDDVDRRYVDAVVKVGKQDFIVPKLTAIAVAFSYF